MDCATLLSNKVNRNLELHFVFFKLKYTYVNFFNQVLYRTYREMNFVYM